MKRVSCLELSPGETPPPTLAKTQLSLRSRHFDIHTQIRWKNPSLTADNYEFLGIWRLFGDGRAKSPPPAKLCSWQPCRVSDWAKDVAGPKDDSPAKLRLRRKLGGERGGQEREKFANTGGCRDGRKIVQHKQNALGCCDETCEPLTKEVN